MYENLEPKIKTEPGKLVFGQKTEKRLWFRARIIWLVFKLGWSIADTTKGGRNYNKDSEKMVMQAIERRYSTKCPVPGRPRRYKHEYIRHGTQSLIAAVDIQTGKVVSRYGPRRTADDLLEFMENVAEAYAGYERIIMIWDNLNIHHDGPDQRWAHINAWQGSIAS